MCMCLPIMFVSNAHYKEIISQKLSLITVTSTTRKRPNLAKYISEENLIDEYHPLVKELLDLDFSLKESICAAEQCDNLKDAIDSITKGFTSTPTVTVSERYSIMNL